MVRNETPILVPRSASFPNALFLVNMPPALLAEEINISRIRQRKKASLPAFSRSVPSWKRDIFGVEKKLPPAS